MRVSNVKGQLLSSWDWGMIWRSSREDNILLILESRTSILRYLLMVIVDVVMVSRLVGVIGLGRRGSMNDRDPVESKNSSKSSGNRRHDTCFLVDMLWSTVVVGFIGWWQIQWFIVVVIVRRWRWSNWSPFIGSHVHCFHGREVLPNQECFRHLFFREVESERRSFAENDAHSSSQGMRVTRVWDTLFRNTCVDCVDCLRNCTQSSAGIPRISQWTPSSPDRESPPFFFLSLNGPWK